MRLLGKGRATTDVSPKEGKADVVLAAMTSPRDLHHLPRPSPIIECKDADYPLRTMSKSENESWAI